jgi:hypothetical protein
MAFNSKYEYILREYSIENYVKNSSVNILFVEALRMFSEYNYSKYNKFRIDSNFPREVLVKIMKPYLLLHMQGLYSLVQTKKTHASLILNKKLLALYKFNSNFGRKIMYPETKSGFGNNRVRYKHYFDDKHIPFHKHSTDFLSSHKTLNNVHDDETDVHQIMNAFEYTVYNVEVYADEINEEDDETVDNDTVDDETVDDETVDDETVTDETVTDETVDNDTVADDTVIVDNENVIVNETTHIVADDNESQSNSQEPDDNSIS